MQYRTQVSIENFKQKKVKKKLLDKADTLNHCDLALPAGPKNFQKKNFQKKKIPKKQWVQNEFFVQ